MLKKDTILLIPTTKNIKHYNSLNYNATIGKELEVKIIDIPFASKYKIDVICDVCQAQKNITVFSYNRNIQQYGFYACSQKCCSEKNKKTNIIRYGEESYTQTAEYIKKTKQTKLERHGDENYVNIDKIKETNNKNYGSDWYIGTKDFIDKSKETCLKKYDKTSYTKTQEYIEKTKQTKLERYGNGNYVNIEKIKETKLKNHNDENYNNREQYKQTCIKHFGVENPMQDPLIVQKMYDAIEEKYGVRHQMHIEEVFNKVIKSGLKIEKFKDTNLYYQGTYELNFLNNYYDKIEIKRGKMIKYIFNGNENIYYPDFFIEKINLIVEIKSTYWKNKHNDKIKAKETACKEQGFNYILIIDKNYDVFNKLMKPLMYNNNYCWQYDIRLKTLEDDKKSIIFDIDNIKISDFSFEYIDKNNIDKCKEIRQFIEKYEWLGNMPNRPTHRFIASYNGILAGVIIMAIPNSFSKLMGDDTKEIERLISRGACASWTPKNLASSLIMWSIKWMVKNTEFRLFTAYADPEAKEIGTIYQACNFIYLGQKYGSEKLYFDINNPNIGWTTGRNFRKLLYFKKIAKNNNIAWKNEWNEKYSILWDKMPVDVKNKLLMISKEKQTDCIVRDIQLKHKYIYVLAETPLKTKILRKKFIDQNKDIIVNKYPKNR